MSQIRDCFANFDASRVPSPCFVIDSIALEANLNVLKNLEDRSGAKVLAALKAFSCGYFGPLFNQYLSGVCASGLHEARLGREKFCGPDNSERRGEVHTFSPAFKPSELTDILSYSDHIVFNSPSEWLRYKENALKARMTHPDLKFGLRINPEHSEGGAGIYDPCAPYSRMGTTIDSLSRALTDCPDLLMGISGLHFHNLCEQSYQPLERTLTSIESKFGQHLHLPSVEWVNFGGGHHITREDYRIDQLIGRIQEFSAKYGVQVYLEPGETVTINTGVLIAEVLDLTQNEKNLAVLDTSATCHMPDTLEMPYRPDIYGAGLPGEKPHNYRLGGMTCLTGDVIGDYSFDKPLAVGQRLIFADMSHYTMVKATTFNGINLPSIAVWDSKTDKLTVLRQFGYDDFTSRLA